MKARVFNDKLNNLNDKNNNECEMEISFQQLADKETGEIIAIVQKETCLKCGESYVTEMWTRDERGESLAFEMGFRDIPFGEDEDDFDDENIEDDGNDESCNDPNNYEKMYRDYYKPSRRRHYLS